MKLWNKSFVCPYCGVLSSQTWYNGYNASLKIFDYMYPRQVNLPFYFTECYHCEAFCIWNYIEDTDSCKLLFPFKSENIPEPNIDLPNDIKKDYIEAMQVLPFSPRASAALLRLALQKLLIELGGDGNNIAQDLRKLEDEQRFPKKLLQVIDFTRFIGNESVHPGILNLNDTPEIANELFAFINLITEYSVSLEKKINKLHNLLPENKKQIK